MTKLMKLLYAAHAPCDCERFLFRGIGVEDKIAVIHSPCDGYGTVLPDDESVFAVDCGVGQARIFTVDICLVIRGKLREADIAPVAAGKIYRSEKAAYVSNCETIRDI